MGSRIRERRVIAGLKQSDLARRVGISPSYLNLIEHNHRRIGGKTLIRLAEALNVAPAVLSEGAEAALVAALREAAAWAAAGDTAGRPMAEIERTEEFAGRFPGWAKLLGDLARRREALEATIKALTDRLAHDPHLDASLHEVISTVTAIRSTASILAGSEPLTPEWQRRFHRNIDEDSARLAEGAEALVRYLEGARDAEADIKSPQDEVHAFLEENGFHFSALEGAALEGGGGAARIEAVLGRSQRLRTEAARHLARQMLRVYVRDARQLPLAALGAALAAHGPDPGALAEALDVDMAMLFRRLAMLPERVAGPVGLVICDGARTLLLRKPVLGFAMPRAAAACALWPLYQVLGQADVPVRLRLRQGEARVIAYAVSEEVAPARFDRPALRRPHMLLLPDFGPGSDALAEREVGVSCQVCPLAGCAARREPSILGGGF